MNIELKILDHKFYYKEGNGMLSHPLPFYATSGSCAVDLYATKDYVIAPQERVMIPTGIAIHIGSGSNGHRIYQDFIPANNQFSDRECLRFKAVIAPRSGRGTDGLVLANTVGWLDEDYQGEIIISAWNSLPELPAYVDVNNVGHWPNTLQIKAGDRIAQMSIVPVVVANWVVVDEFTEKTDRGDGGFGHTGG